MLYLSTFAATAAYYDALPEKPASLEAYIAEVERFAYDEYLPALSKGYSIPAEQRQAIAAKLARYTGTTAEFLAAGRPARQPHAVPPGIIARRAGSSPAGSTPVSRAVLEPAQRHDGLRPVLTGQCGPHSPRVSAAYLRSDLKFELRMNMSSPATCTSRGTGSHAQPGVDREDYPKVPRQTCSRLASAMTMNPGLHFSSSRVDTTSRPQASR